MLPFLHSGPQSPMFSLYRRFMEEQEACHLIPGRSGELQKLLETLYNPALYAWRDSPDRKTDYRCDFPLYSKWDSPTRNAALAPCAPEENSPVTFSHGAVPPLERFRWLPPVAWSAFWQPADTFARVASRHCTIP